MADGHADGAEEEEVAATPLLDEVETGDGGGDVDAGGNHADDKGVLDTRVLEEGCSVVEDEVDTGKLLERLKQATSQQALAEVATEAVEVRGLAERHFVLVVGSDLSELLDEGGVLDIKAAEGGERLGSLFRATLLDEPAGSLGKPDAADKENNSPSKLDGNGDAVRARIGSVLGGVVDNGSEKQTDGNGKLVATNNGTTNPLGGSLGLVERNDGTDHTDSVTGKETTSNEQGNISGNGLKNDTDAEDDGADDETQATTEEISSWRRGQGTEEGTSGKDGDDQRGLLGGDIGLTILLVDEASAEDLSPVFHAQDTTNGTSVITVETLVYHL